MNKAIVCAVAVFLVFFSSVIVNAPLTCADSVVIPKMQKAQSPHAQNNNANTAIISRAYIKNPVFGT